MIGMLNFGEGKDKVLDVQCGPAHSLAVTGEGRVFTWGQGVKGKLGLGFKPSLRECTNQHFPREVTKGGFREDGEPPEPLAHAGCGLTFSLLLQQRGWAWQLGKMNNMTIAFDDYRKSSRPQRLLAESKLQTIVTKVSVGMDHYMMTDTGGTFWCCGENSRGNLGTNDDKDRVVPSQMSFFDNKRIIDFACGDQFTVVIAETFNMPKHIERLYYDTEKKSLSDIGKSSRTGKKMYSTKMGVQCTEKYICDQGLKDATVPSGLRNKIQELLKRKADRKAQLLQRQGLLRQMNSRKQFTEDSSEPEPWP